MKLFVVGGGFTGSAVVRAFRAAASAGDERIGALDALSIVATTRSAARAEALRAAGTTPLLAEVLTNEIVTSHVDAETFVVVTMPPDGVTDRRLAPALVHAAALAYVSSTGVYGDASGRVDEETPVVSGASTGAPPRARARVEAEEQWRAAGATILRAPAIYGPGRGLHLRLARGEVRLAGTGTNAISRVHVDDLARALVASLARRVRGGLYVVGDREPAPHHEVVRYLCERLALPFPPVDPLAATDETLRHDRRVDSARIGKDLDFRPRYATYREGYSQCIEVDRAALEAAASARAGGV